MTACSSSGIADFLASFFVENFVCRAALPADDYDNAAGRTLMKCQLAGLAIIAPTEGFIKMNMLLTDRKDGWLCVHRPQLY
jgi:hypothetical protein